MVSPISSSSGIFRYPQLVCIAAANLIDLFCCGVYNPHQDRRQTTQNVQSLLMKGCDRGSIPLVRSALAGGADPGLLDQDGESALSLAVRGNHLAIVSLLLDGRADPNEENGDGKTLLFLAVSCCRLDMATLLLNRGADPNKDTGEDSLLSQAIFFNCLDIVTLLLDRGANINVQNKRNGWTPLHTACYMNSPSIVKFLLAREADLNIPDRNGEPPLFVAATYSGLGIVKLLLDRGAQANAKNTNGDTLLSRLIFHNRVEAVKYLLNERAADPSIPNDRDGWTPLHVACHENCLSIVELLPRELNNVRNKQGQRPSDLTEMPEIKNYLLGTPAG